jgi:sn-glycerol 3-phosphate transport system permease protein
VQNIAFPNKALPYFLVAPQIILTIIVFFWPAGRALFQSTLREYPFSMKSGFVGLANFSAILADPACLNSLVLRDG